jgi:hypothetical protein
MRSLANRGRIVAEWALRGVAVAAVTGMLWRALHPAAVEATRSARSSQLEHLLPDWTQADVRAVRLALDSLPDAHTRAWLRALRAAGTKVSWTSTISFPATAIVAEPIADPGRGTRLLVAIPAKAVAALRDRAGLLDSVRTADGAATAVLGDAASPITLATAGAPAVAAPRDSLALRAVLVLGSAGWETKFTLLALEERGWTTAARIGVAPNVNVTQGTVGAIDTARYAAVIALDSSATRYATEIARFVREGGGLVLGPGASAASQFAALRVGAAGRRTPGLAGAVHSDRAREGLTLSPVANPMRGGVPLEMRGALTAIAARREGAGRVLQLGYDDTWRWRVEGADGAVEAHRAWWSTMVGSVAYAPIIALGDSVARNEVPLAALVNDLGGPAPSTGRLTSDLDASRVTWLWFTVFAVALLLEWGSRRLRGAR